MNAVFKNARWGEIMHTKGPQGDLRVWQLRKGGRGPIRIAVLLDTAGRKDIESHDHVRFEVIGGCDNELQGRLAGGPAAVVKRFRPREFIQDSHPRLSRVAVQSGIRTKPFPESPELKANLQLALRDADVASAGAFIIYDPGFLGGAVTCGGLNSSPYALAVIGKTEETVKKAGAMVSLACDGASLTDLGRNLDMALFIMEETHRMSPTIHENRLAASIYTTGYNPSSALDRMLQNGRLGDVTAIPVAGLARVQDRRPGIEDEALRFCMGCVRLD